MRQPGLAGLALVLSVVGLTAPAGAQLPTQRPDAAPQGSSPFTPAPTASHPLSPTGSDPSMQPVTANQPIASDSVQVRINGRVTTYVGVGSGR